MKKPMTIRELSKDVSVGKWFPQSIQWERSSLTGSLEDEVNLSREVLAVEVVLRGSVEVELEEVVVLGANLGSAGGDDLDGGAKVQELGLVDVGDVEGKVRATDDGVLALDDVDGGLVLADGAELVGLAQAVPVKGALELMVAKGRALSTGEEGGAVVADGRGHRGEGEDDSRGLHFD